MSNVEEEEIKEIEEVRDKYKIYKITMKIWADRNNRNKVRKKERWIQLTGVIQKWNVKDLMNYNNEQKG